MWPSQTPHSLTLVKPFAFSHCLIKRQLLTIIPKNIQSLWLNNRLISLQNQSDLDLWVKTDIDQYWVFANLLVLAFIVANKWKRKRGDGEKNTLQPCWHSLSTRGHSATSLLMTYFRNTANLKKKQNKKKNVSEQSPTDKQTNT